MNITIVGGGNIGTQFAVHCAEKKHCVTIFSSKPESIDKHLVIVDENKNIVREGDINKATSDVEEAFLQAELIFITLPAFCMADIANKIFPYVKKGMKIGIIPGTGGAECAFRKCMEKGCILFGIQRVPSVARLIEYGKSVCAVGYRRELHIAAFMQQYTEECCQLMSELFEMPCIGLPNYLNITLTPSNAILHTTRLYTIFRDYKQEKIYNEVPLFYQEWDDQSSEILLKCDDEVQAICKGISEIDLSYVNSLRIHYESETPQQLTKKISGIQSFKGLKTPVVQKGEGVIPDLNSRYFTADFPYGLAILIQVADFVGVEAENMKMVMEWYKTVSKKEEEIFDYNDCGITNYDDMIKFYLA